jgi:hypothetical protein
VDFLHKHRLHIGTGVLPDVEIVLRKTPGESEQMLAFLRALAARE